ncbi:uncharacterized protein LOC121235368 [Juglans microcarpa x Juglans regia]|uniref:uncharacterized protein LOC121235368 n=1 Tax=Juglans microcarpa x Juglans regia TaxID=2249226 RepID=UPI001B7ED051|nr:uncharacterized protein LOC121235368 [Juglans microcarpa x Juglans regia]
MDTSLWPATVKDKTHADVRDFRDNTEMLRGQHCHMQKPSLHLEGHIWSGSIGKRLWLCRPYHLNPEAIPEVNIPLRQPRHVEGEVFVQFTKEELDRSAVPFRFSLVLKFLRQRPSLDRIRGFIHSRWGLSTQPMVSVMRKPRNVFVQFSNEDDFLKAISWESCDIEGAAYRAFQWTVDFKEDEEPVQVPVWIMLPSLPPNLYQESYLRNIVAPIGIFLRMDNATRCATRTDGARVCVLMNIDQDPISSFWIGTPRHPASFCQEVEYETLPAFCSCYKVQGHNLKTCKTKLKEGKDPMNLRTMKSNRVWVPKEKEDADNAEKDPPGKTIESSSVLVIHNVEANELKDGSTEGVVSLDAEIDKGETEIDREEAEPLVHEKDLTMLAESSGAQSDRELDLVMGDDQVLHPVVVSAMEGLEDNSKVQIGGTRVPSSEDLQLAIFDQAYLGMESKSEDEAELAHPAKEKDGSSDFELSKKKLSHVILGDYNILRNDSEWRGGCLRLLMAMEEFCSFIDTGGLVEIPFLGNKFSWCNEQSGMARLWAQLDKDLCNLKFLELFPSVHNHYLPRRSSDHSPMLLGLSATLSRYGPSSFKFHFMWTTHEDFWRCVSSSWEGGVYGIGLWKLAKKLKRLKQVLRTWNKEIFGWTGRHIKDLEIKVEEGEASLQERFSEDVEMDVLANKMELDVWLKREEARLAQQFKHDWILQGETSSSFFKALQSRKHNIVMEMKMSDGRVLSSPEAIHEEACVYFEEFLKANQSSSLPNLADLISGDVSEEENKIFRSPPLMDEVKNALFSIPKDSSSGSDGFGSGFYQHCWSLVKEDVFEAITDFFSGTELLRFYTASYIVLLPKIQNPTSFGNFRPISLCSVVYKICSKILVNRFSMLFSRIISKEQEAFLPGFGFSLKIRQLLRQCVTTPWYSIVMNGTTKGFFKGGRGLRQGDPLFPYLFILVEEVLSRLIKKKYEEGIVKCYSLPRHSRIVSHLLYADDMIICSNCGKSSILEIVGILNTYASWSGQQLVGAGKATEITNEIKGQRLGEDKLVWLGNSEGSFTSMSAWSLVRERNNNVEWTDWIWNVAIPKKLSVFMWKALNLSLGVDD